MQEFLQENRQLPQDALQPFAMEQIRRDLDGYRISPPPLGSPAWAKEFEPGEQARMNAVFPASKVAGMTSRGFSPAEFQRFQQMERNQSPRIISPPMQSNGYRRPMGMSYGMNGMGSMGMYNHMSMQRRPMGSAAQTKGKGRMVELDDHDWEQQFAEIDAAGKQQEHVLDSDANAAIEAELNTLDRSVPLTETNEFGDFESVWRGIQAENAEYASQMYSDNDLRSWDSANLSARDFDTWDTFDGIHNPDFHSGEYLFEDSNIFSNAKDPFSEGIRIIREAGNLSLAALAFEAAVQKDPQHIEAWVALGNAQAQNEKETPAIRALEHAVQMDPTNLPALMGLAISYTNEGYESTAYRTLERWLSTKYPSILPPDQVSGPQEMGFTDRHLLHEKVTNNFIRAAQLSPQGEHMDPDVQVGLGVLFYGAEEYAKAVDCFEAALASSEQGHSNHRDQAHLLWNRLGATLANSGRSEEAIQAYERALQLNPNFVRA
ncbi:MAG: hypothetical protein Q9211_004223, partial [Gyalolechia sp. 1 TL-2023]